jgi:DNA repair protein RecO (recombination protein O)
MGLEKTQAVVIGRHDLGESDRLVEFYTRQFGKVRGVAKAARRTRSRFGSALEPFSLGELVFFESGRSDLVRVDHFDLLHPFVRAREELRRLGQGAWILECLGRLSAERDPHVGLYALLVRSLRALDGGWPPERVAICFAARAVDLLGHRPRIDRCVACGRPYPFPDPVLDMGAGGLCCAACGAGADAIVLSGPAVGVLGRLRSLRWEESLGLPLVGPLEGEVLAVLQGVMVRLIGQVPRVTRFLAQTRRTLGLVVEPPPSRPR